MNIMIAETFDKLSRQAAEQVVSYIKQHPGSLICLSGCPTNVGLYRELLSFQEEGKVDLTSVFYGGLEEWGGVSREISGTSYRTLHDCFFHPAGIPDKQIHLFDGSAPDLQQQCTMMDDWIEKRGGIGMAVAGMEANGRIAFNEPNGPSGEGCFLVSLTKESKQSCLRYFGKPTWVEGGLTVGWRQLNSSSCILLLASGVETAKAVFRACNGPVSQSSPGSLLQCHPNLTFLVDWTAASSL